MLSPEILSKIKQIEIQTRRIASSTLVGSRSSARKGTGFDFDQIREYQFGDDVRFIDWKSSARHSKILVRQYIEERSRTIILLVDGSSSGKCGSEVNSKYECIAQVASVLALIAQYGSDRVSLILFSDVIDTFIPLRSSVHHTEHIMYQLFSHTVKVAKTNVAHALQEVMRMRLKNASVFVISDFIAPDFSKELAQVARKHEVIAIRCLDKNERIMPDVGSIRCEDPETGMLIDIDAHMINVFLSQRILNQNNIFSKYGIEYLDLIPNHFYIENVITFLCRQMKY